MARRFALELLITRIKYRGCYYKDDRFGYGVLYDRRGVIEYEGYWKRDKPSLFVFDGATINSYTESLIIPLFSFNRQETLSLPSFLRLLKEVRLAKAAVTRSRRVRSYGRQRQTVHTGYEELRSVERSTLDLPSFTHLDAASFNFRSIESIVLASTCELDSLMKTFPF